MDDVTLLVHDADKSHKVLIRKEKLEDKVVKSLPKTKESLKLMKPINDYSALLVNEMRKHPVRRHPVWMIGSASSLIRPG